jgi:hypothetical protein
MTPSKTPLRIRVVDIASEAAGVPDSVWVRADQEVPDIEADINEWASKSPFDSIEGVAVREYEGFGDVVFEGDEDLSVISRLALLIRRYGTVFIDVLKRIYSGEVRYTAEAERLFEEHYIGGFDSMAAWGQEFAARMELACDELLEHHVDWVAFAKDAEEEGHFTTITDANGRVHAFGR